MEDNNQKKKQRNKWLSLINIPVQMGAIIFVFAFVGKWLDEKYSNPDEIYTKSITILGVFIAMYNVYRQVKEIGNSE